MFRARSRTRVACDTARSRVRSGRRGSLTTACGSIRATSRYCAGACPITIHGIARGRAVHAVWTRAVLRIRRARLTGRRISRDSHDAWIAISRGSHHRAARFRPPNNVNRVAAAISRTCAALVALAIGAVIAGSRDQPCQRDLRRRRACADATASSACENAQAARIEVFRDGAAARGAFREIALVAILSGQESARERVIRTTPRCLATRERLRARSRNPCATMRLYSGCRTS